MTCQSWGIMILLAWAPWQETQTSKGKAALVTKTEKYERALWVEAQRCTYNSQIIPPLSFLPSKFPSADVSAMPMRGPIMTLHLMNPE